MWGPESMFHVGKGLWDMIELKVQFPRVSLAEILKQKGLGVTWFPSNGLLISYGTSGLCFEAVWTQHGFGHDLLGRKWRDHLGTQS